VELVVVGIVIVQDVIWFADNSGDFAQTDEVMLFCVAGNWRTTRSTWCTS